MPALELRAFSRPRTAPYPLGAGKSAVYGVGAGRERLFLRSSMRFRRSQVRAMRLGRCSGTGKCRGRCRRLGGGRTSAPRDLAHNGDRQQWSRRSLGVSWATISAGCMSSARMQRASKAIIGLKLESAIRGQRLASDFLSGKFALWSWRVRSRGTHPTQKLRVRLFKLRKKRAGILALSAYLPLRRRNVGSAGGGRILSPLLTLLFSVSSRGSCSATLT